MKTDRQIAEEAFKVWSGEPATDLHDLCEKAISLARQYGALAPAAPLSFVQQAAIGAMQGMLARPITNEDDDSHTPASVSFWAVEHAIELEKALEAAANLALKKGGAE